MQAFREGNRRAMAARHESAPRKGEDGARVTAVQKFCDHINCCQAGAGDEHGRIRRDPILAIGLPGIIENQALRLGAKLRAERGGRLVAGCLLYTSRCV